MNNILIDTNIYLYALNADSAYHSRCCHLLKSDLNLFTTVKNISEYFAVCTKLKLDHQIVWSFYDSIKKNVTVLFPNDESLQLLEVLLIKYKPIGNRVFDLEVASVMMNNQIEFLATINSKDFEQINEIKLYIF
jgi:predicted nucleic acid-binding protein